MSSLDLNVGFYDPLSAFKGGFQNDFISHTEIPQITLRTPFSKVPLQMKNIHLTYKEELPADHEDLKPYLKFMFIVAPNVDDYRSTARPLIKQWIQKVNGLQPRLPLFIILFESTELKYATDKLLKTSIESKLKKDFPVNEFPNLNIFRIKSIYTTHDEKLALWATLKERLKISLSLSISNKLNYFSDDEIHKARIFNELKMYQEASLCYETLFNQIDYIKEEDGLESFQLSSMKSIFNKNMTFGEPLTKFDEKLTYFRHLVSILVNSRSTLTQKNENTNKEIDFLMNLINSIQLTDKRHEFSYLLILEFLNLDYVKPLLEPKSGSTNNESLANSSSHTIKLLLLQRNELLKLGTSKGYQLKGTFVDVALHKIDKPYSIETKSLQSILETYNSFSNEILAKTKDIILKFKTTKNNEHTIATLEAEVALMLHYNPDAFSNYSDDETLNYLYDAYQHFSNKRWDGISLSLLDVYIKHLEIKLNFSNLPAADRFSTILTLFESYMTLISLHPAVFNQKTLEKYLAYFKYLDYKTESDDLMFEVPDLLDLSDVSSLFCSDVDVYALDVTLKTPVRGMLVQNIVLELTSITETNTVIYFEWNTDLSKELKADLAYTTTNSVFAEGTYNVSKIFATIASSEDRRISVTHTYDPKVSKKISIFQIPVFKSGEQIKKNTIATVRIPSSRWLHKDALEFAVTIGDIEEENDQAIFTFYKIEPDRIVANPTYSLTLNDKDTNNFEILDIEDKIIFTLNGLMIKKGTILVLSIPFFFPAEITNTKINLQYSFEYKPKQVNLAAVIQYHTDSLLTHLNIAASVDERIQHNALFCFFNLNSISSKLPLCIQKVTLEAERSDIKKWKIPTDVIVFMDQGSSFFFCINELKDKEVRLKIEYSNLIDEMIEYVEFTFNKRLLESENDSDLIKYSSIVKKIWSECEFKTNYYALTGNIIPHEFLVAHDSDNLAMIPVLDRKRLLEHLTQHAASLFEISKNGSKKEFDRIRKSVKQILWLPVKLPNIDIIVTAEYNYEKSLQYLVGEPIEVSIHLTVNSFEGGRAYYAINKEKNMKTERKVRFDDANSLKSQNTGNNVSLALEFLDDSQSWLISGILDLNLEIEPYTTYTKKQDFEVYFIPLKSGKIELPTLTTKLPHGCKLDLHLDFKNKSEVITVVNQLNTVTQLH